MTGWRPALRVARREAQRAKGRSLLVVAMIMLPVAALAFAAVYRDTFTLTADERADRLMGTAQAVLARPFDDPVHQDPTDLDAFGPPGALPPTAEPRRRGARRGRGGLGRAARHRHRRRRPAAA